MSLMRWVVAAAMGVSMTASLAGSATSFFQVHITVHTGLAAPAAPAAPGSPEGSPAPLPVGPGEAPNEPAPVTGALPGGSGGQAPEPMAPAAPSLPTGSGIATVARPAAGSICTSQTLSDAAQATVRVSCSSGQFVSIEPSPGKPFAGSHGGAFRFNFGPGLPFASALAGTNGFHAGAGTVTSLRVVNLSGRETPLEMLVSF